MMTIVGVAEAALYVSDLDRATASYTQQLGLPLTAAFGDARFLQTGRSSTPILFNSDGIRRRKSPIPNHGSVGEGHVALAVAADDLDDWRERLGRLGVAIEHEQTWSSGTRSLYFRDPDNSSLELISDDHYPTIWQSLMAPDASN
jgi:catechol 2,3-dioxygenase-like lactoylglutathione lyase family enzyme